MAMGIARSSMELASQRVATETQTAMLRKVMDFQEENMALLLKSMGMGQNLSVRA
ncbi:MAG: YjfB family protein [Synergistaceae bacterium]|nr:YjfB family protein [Synergistaceae bacterium]